MNDQRITSGMIHPSIRLTGRILRRILHFKSETTFVRLQRLMPAARRLIRPKGFCCEQQTVAVPGHSRLRLLICRPRKPRPEAVGLLWLHGGGYAIGTPEQDFSFIQKFIAAANCVIVSPDYRLSVQSPYPAAVSDCYQTLLWMKTHARLLGIRPDQLFVGGDSAGGGLAAAVTLMARDRGEVSVAFQMPLYPMLDDRMITPSSRNKDAPVWDTRANKAAWRLYLGDLYGTDTVPVYAAPARETDFRGLPPAYTFVGELEPFRDETAQYISRLNEAGVQAEMDVYPGCFHAFDIVCAHASVARRAARRYVERFQHAAKTCFARQPDEMDM